MTWGQGFGQQSYYDWLNRMRHQQQYNAPHQQQQEQPLNATGVLCAHKVPVKAYCKWCDAYKNACDAEVVKVKDEVKLLEKK